MTVDYSGIAVLVGAVTAGFVSIGTFVMQWLAGRKAEKNKAEAMAAREAQTSTIIQSAVTPALNSPPPAKPEETGEA
jgi:hypothetical protein